MTKIEETVRIPASVDQVFSVTADWRRWEEWFVGVSGFTPTTEQMQGNGAKYRYRAKMFGLPATVETQISNYRENCGWTGEGVRGLPHRTHWIFRPTSDGTQFTYALEFQLPPVLHQLFAPLLAREWRRIISASLQNLKDLIAAEAHATGGP